MVFFDPTLTQLAERLELLDPPRTRSVFFEVLHSIRLYSSYAGHTVSLPAIIQ